MKNIREEVQKFLSKNAINEFSEKDVKEKIEYILNSNFGLSDSKDKMVESIKEFMESNEENKGKLLAYCLNYFDPSIEDQNCADICEEVELHKFLDKDELKLLSNFVNGHKDDIKFGGTVFKLIDKRNIDAPDVYKSVMLSRQDFSRATKWSNERVSRHLVWHIIMGLKCNIKEAEMLLFTAGYTSRACLFDLIMEYFIETKNYDMFAVNDVLNDYGLKPFKLNKNVRDKDNI